ncbi:MAG TPA: Mur ligase domain-containing protein, partial [Kofleriaceae bacterium]|nr:Mur ligase domain-containing protein [Kofleriaceae bacterium]
MSEPAAARWAFPLADVLRETGGRLAQAGAGEFARIILDGRTAAPGDLYVAVRGDSHDGHAFIDQAVAAGAAGVIVDRGGRAPAGVAVIEVDDSRLAMGAIARWHSRRWGLANPKARLVAITGSAGKTTTKQLTAAALGAVAPVLATEGSLNNETGVPLT